MNKKKYENLFLEIIKLYQKAREVRFSNRKYYKSL